MHGGSSDTVLCLHQDVAPMTEDRLQEQSEVLVSLGTNTEGCQLRARMMAASLTSDMEAFKVRGGDGQGGGGTRARDLGVAGGGDTATGLGGVW